VIGRGSLAWPGAPIALASAALFGASTPFAKLLLGGGMDPWLLAGLLYLSAGIGLALMPLAQCSLGRARIEAPLRSKDLPLLTLITMAGGILGPVLLMLGLARTDASSAALLLNLEGVARLRSAHVDRQGLRQQPDPQTELGRSGAARDGEEPFRRRGERYARPHQWRFAARAIVAGRRRCGRPFRLRRELGSLRAGAAVPRHGSHSRLLFLRPIHCAPFIGAALSVLMFRDPLTAQLVVAGMLMAVGVYLHLSEAHEHEHAHQGMEHEHRHAHDEHHSHVHEAGLLGEPHSHRHRHTELMHRHPHYPDPHHRHGH
jgi:hypothetical protein